MEGKRAEAIDEFWQHVAHCDHSVQIYEDETNFLDTLERFVLAGLRQGEAVIVIATPAHRAALNARLEQQGIDVAQASACGQYLQRDARSCLARFMFDGWPAEARFNALIEELLASARSRYPQVRAFGEMVALLWDDGLYRATMRLEHLWTQLCRREGFPLFCAYPKAAFDASGQSCREVCQAHDRSIEPHDD